ncbi:MAG TPA: Rnf-Nqr domain containing protein [Rhodanobacteraceae bacterium]|nr:Rnf-Nqr domain containing protein [Rhodanobacteraceae bacterium]
MTGFIAILIGAALANNAVLSHLLGLDPALRADVRLRDAGLLGLTTACIVLFAAAACWLIEHLLLVPFDLDWLRVLVWLLVVAALAPWPRMLLHRRADAALSPALLIGNGLVLGAVALNARSDFMTTLARSFGTAAGFGIMLLLFTAMHDRLEGADVPAPFRGVPILLISAGIMALGFMGFAGFGR